MDQGIQQLNQALQASQSTQKADRENATRYLSQLRLDGPTTEAMLGLICSNDPAVTDGNRQMAAIQIKNLVKGVFGSSDSYRNYDDQSNAQNGHVQVQEGEMLAQEEPIDENGRKILHERLVPLMLQCQQSGKKMLTNIFLEIIATMARRYVQNEWPQLFPSLIDQLKQQQDPNIVNTIFGCAKKICKKYRYMFRSDALYTEMNYVIELFSQHLVDTLAQCVSQAQQPEAQQNEAHIRCLYGVMNSILHIIESILSQEELPDFYEENLPSIMEACFFIVAQDYPQFAAVPEEVMKARGKVVSLLYLYNFKFSEYFVQFEAQAFQAIWSLIEQNKVQATKKSENLIKTTMKYLGDVTNNPSKVEFVKSNLQKIFDVLILPNIAITSDDQDEYEDDPHAYIRNDLEESDVETRRRNCLKFVQKLSKSFRAEVGALVGGYIDRFLADYQNNREQQWTQKASLLNLLITACVSQYSFRTGVWELTISEEQLFTYISGYVLPELQEQQIDNLPLLKATCMKFVYMFRVQIPSEHTLNFVGLFAEHLKSESIVNQSYAAACIDKFLTKQDKATKKPVVNKGNIGENTVTQLLQNLCALLSQQKNLYAMRALYRVIQISQDQIQAFTETLGQVLHQFIKDAATDENDQSPNYIYLLFETAALSLKYSRANEQSMTQMRNALLPVLIEIINNNKTELMGYAFQLFALFVASHSELQEVYKALVQSLLANQSNWEKDMKYLMPAMGQFIIAMICKHPQFMSGYSNELDQIIRHLMKTDVRMETVGLQIGSALFERIGIAHLSPDMLKEFLMCIFTSMSFYRNNTKNKVIPVKITVAVFIFFATFLVNNGIDALLQACDKIQPGILFMILKSEGNKISYCSTPARDRKYVLWAFTNLVCERPASFQEDSIKGVVQSLIDLAHRSQASQAVVFKVASAVEGDLDDMLVEDAVDQSIVFQRQSHIQLHSASVVQTDILKGKVDQPEKYFMERMAAFTQAQGQSIQVFLDNQKQREKLQSLMQQTGVQMQ